MGVLCSSTSVKHSLDDRLMQVALAPITLSPGAAEAVMANEMSTFGGITLSLTLTLWFDAHSSVVLCLIYTRLYTPLWCHVIWTPSCDAQIDEGSL